MEMHVPELEELMSWPEARRREYAKRLAEVDDVIRARPDWMMMLTAHEKQRQVINSRARVLLYCSGNKGGKTTAVSLTVNKTALEEPGCEQWICSVDYPASLSGPEKSFWMVVPKGALEDVSCFTPERGFKNNCCVYQNGSVVRFKTYETTVLGAQQIRRIALDEEPQYQSIYDECYLRTADHPKGQLLLVWTAVNGYTWSYHKLYRLKPNLPDWLEIVIGATEDNRVNLPDGTIEGMKEQFVGAIQRARLFGEYVSIGGTSVFDMEQLSRALQKVTKGIRYQMSLIDVRRSVRRRAEYREPGWEVWEEPMAGHDYSMGADTATGYGGENAALTVIDGRSLRVVAVLGGKYEPDELARQAVAMGLWYNNAMVVGERNGIGTAFVMALQRLGYGWIWRDRSKTDRPEGFWTSETSRALILRDVINAFRDGLLEVPDEATLLEMSTFVYKTNGRTEHEEGCMDDRIFSLGLALHGVLTATGRECGVAAREHMVVVRREREEPAPVVMRW